MRLPYLLHLGARIQTGLARLPLEVRQRHRNFLLSRQLPDGGFVGRELDLNGQPVHEDGPQSDLYYTSFAVRALASLGEIDDDVAKRVGVWLKGQAGRTASVIDLVSWLYTALVVQGASGVDMLADAPADWPQRLADLLESFRADDGGYAKTRAGAMGSTYHSFLVALCYDLIDLPLPDADALLTFIRQRRLPDGGFVEIAPMRRSGTNPTAAAIALLKLFDALDDDIRLGAARFLRDVRGDDGGMVANTRIPFSDLLSTFTGYLTALELGESRLLPAARLRKFVDALEQPTGGYIAAGWDNHADVEYTFYGLGTLGLHLAEAGDI